eukprot:1028900-Pleurochrysis_carterae.AAC.1
MPLVLVLSRAVACKSTPIDASTIAYLTDASCATYDAPRQQSAAATCHLPLLTSPRVALCAGPHGFTNASHAASGPCPRSAV